MLFCWQAASGLEGGRAVLGETYQVQSSEWRNGEGKSRLFWAATGVTQARWLSLVYRSLRKPYCTTSLRTVFGNLA